LFSIFWIFQKKKQGKGVQKSDYDKLFQNFCIYMVAETKKRQ
jgi:hypothetical protein